MLFYTACSGSATQQLILNRHMSLILNKNRSTTKPYFGIFEPCKLLLVVDASSDLKLIILLIIVYINCTMANLILQSNHSANILLRIIQSYYFETK